MYIFRCDIFQIYSEYFGADLHIVRHFRLGNDVIELQRRIGCKLHSIARFTGKPSAGRVFQALTVYLLDALNHFKQPCSAADTVCL